MSLELEAGRHNHITCESRRRLVQMKVSRINYMDCEITKRVLSELTEASIPVRRWWKWWQNWCSLLLVGAVKAPYPQLDKEFSAILGLRYDPYLEQRKKNNQCFLRSWNFMSLVSEIPADSLIWWLGFLNPATQAHSGHAQLTRCSLVL